MIPSRRRRRLGSGRYQPATQPEPVNADSAPPIVRQVLDIDIKLADGTLVQLTQTDADNFVEDPSAFIFTYASGEIVTIFKPHIALISRRQRTITTPATALQTPDHGPSDISPRTA